MKYQFHAETFYQLYCVRHSSTAMVPYMIKLVDHVPEMMNSLPFPVGRFDLK